jgi:hypothetical protein
MDQDHETLSREAHHRDDVARRLAPRAAQGAGEMNAVISGPSGVIPASVRR